MPSGFLRRALVVCAAALLYPSVLSAQGGPTVAPAAAPASAAAASAAAEPVIQRAAGGTVIRATRITTPLKIDGRIDDAAYREVAPITDFIQQEPVEGAPISERTEVWVLFDDDNVYFTCRCWQPPDGIIANDMRRDSTNHRFHDSFGVIIDTFHDRRNGMLFTITALGGFTDALTTDERSFTPDWNTVWENKVERFEGGWIAEMAIPFKSLRYKAGREQTWGLNLRRLIRERNEYGFVVPMSKAWGTSNAFFRVSAAATLTGIEAPPVAKNLEVKPFAIANMTTDRVGTPRLDNEVDPDFGFDLKYGVTKSLTADFTYNTDFAQVEVDEAEVNLTRFALSFPEKREFFLEGAGMFQFGQIGGGNTGNNSGDAPTMFYSRRIGLSGGRSVPIVAGGRLTGKVGKWSVGALNIESDDDVTARAAQTNFSVMRLRRDVLRRSNIGAMVTNRSVALAGPGSNQMFGVDANFAFFQNLSMGGYVARTETPGLDGDDYSYRANFNYAGDRYGVQVDRLAVEDNFNPEVGFMRREDFRSNTAALRFSPRPARARTVRQYHYEGGFEYITDTDNRLESREQRGSFRVDLQNGDQFTASAQRNYEYLAQPFLISQGVRIPVGGYTFDTYRLAYGPGPRHRVTGTFAAEWGSFYDGDRTTLSARGRTDISSRLAFEPNISLNWIELPQGSFTTTVFGGRGTYTIHPRAFVAALVQYTSGTSSVLSNVRLRWEYSPGSELFVVYSEGRDTFPPRGMPLENRGLAVKVTRLVRF